MSKLIGTNPNQVPSNADLGTAAFMNEKDFLTSRGSSLSDIDAVIPKTAFDVLVYDTRKDSDGGAWRKRTQHTSWYKEKLNTPTRGSRREFPAVAVIVAEANRISIYDGDDATLPMWMTIEPGGIIDWATSNQSRLAIDMVNGQLTKVGHDGGAIFSFIEDYVYIIYSSQSYPITSSRTIEGRNDPSSYISATGAAQNVYVVLTYSMRDVAMTVLPNAPISRATGLPTPTIAVATDSGVSVIKDDGTVVDITHTASTHTDTKNISFSGNRICYSSQQSGSSTTFWRRIFIDIPDADVTGAYAHNIPGTTIYDARGNSGNTPAINVIDNLGHFTNDANDAVSDKAVAFDDKVTLLDVDDFPGVGGNPSSSATKLAYISQNYNTGWMPGDIRLAAIADTDPSDSYDFVEGYGDFTVGSAWTVDTGWSTPSNVAQKTGGTGSNYIYKSIGRQFEYGKWYQAEFDLLSGSGTGVLLVNRHINGVPKPYSGGATNVDVAFFQGFGGKYYAVWQQSHLNNGIISLYAGSAVSLDNLKVYEVGSHDRTSKIGSLLRVGTALKSTPVASGAELRSYGGFSGYNGLIQPYSSNLDPGAGDYSFIIWFKTDPTSAEQTIMRRFGNPTVTGGTLMRITGSTSLLSWYTRDTSSTVGVANSPHAVDDGLWHMAVGVRDGNRAKLYLDGVEVADVSTSANSHNPGNTAMLHIGVENTSNFGVFSNPSSVTELALARYALTAPTAEQIRKMYEDEKALFRDNAKATLYGNSGSVLALAYDDDTNLLHAGTSAGRSVFQGLRRVDNTTSAVGTAISASNGMVVEE